MSGAEGPSARRGSVEGDGQDALSQPDLFHFSRSRRPGGQRPAGRAGRKDLHARSAVLAQEVEHEGVEIGRHHKRGAAPRLRAGPRDGKQETEQDAQEERYGPTQGTGRHTASLAVHPEGPRSRSAMDQINRRFPRWETEPFRSVSCRATSRRTRGWDPALGSSRPSSTGALPEPWRPAGRGSGRRPTPGPRDWEAARPWSAENRCRRHRACWPGTPRRISCPTALRTAPATAHIWPARTSSLLRRKGGSLQRARYS